MSPFQDTLLGLEHTSAAPLDSFSSACLEVAECRDPDSYDYRLSQVFEPEVLTEVALLRGLDAAAVATLDHAPTSTTAGLRAEVDAGAPRTALVPSTSRPSW